MNLNWQTFWSSLIGTTIPGLFVSLLLLWLNRKNTQAIESYKQELAEASGQHALWHQKRIDALIEIHDAFAQYLAFLHRQYYVPGIQRESMDSYWEYSDLLRKNMVFLDSNLRQFIGKLDYELHQFNSWALREPRGEGISGDSVQKRLDKEIPLVLERLRLKISEYADPKYDPESPWVKAIAQETERVIFPQGEPVERDDGNAKESV